MKIVKVTTTHLHQSFRSTVHSGAHTISERDVLLAEVLTDEGLTGTGFITGLGQAHGSEIPVIRLIIDRALAPAIVGADSGQIEQLWQLMYRTTLRYGRRGAAIRAISAVDLALWDLLGRRARLPLHRLLGGFTRRVRPYVTCGYYADGKDTDALADEVQQYVSQGFRALKIKVGKLSLAEDTARLQAVRKAAGDGVQIMVDTNGAWDTVTAVKAVKRWAAFDLEWVEEPVSPDNTEGLAEVARNSGGVPVAAGENEYTREGFLGLIRHGCRYLQPDVTRTGGITEWRKILALCETFDRPVAPHGVHELHVQLAAGLPGVALVEYFAPDHPLQSFLSQLFPEPAGARTPDSDGFLNPSDDPGLGLTLDESMARAHQAT